jgi:RimJ/RimL family protein N-acetyltransferase
MSELVINITIRPFKIDDINDIHVYASNPITTQYMLWGPNTIEDTQGFLNYVLDKYAQTPITHFEHGIEYEGKIIGGIALIVDYEKKDAEIGWILHEAYQRKGVMFQAAKEMIEFAKSIGVKSLHATADSRNVASYKLMEKLGMKHIETRFQSRYNKVTKQTDLDEVYYEMTL